MDLTSVLSGNVEGRLTLLALLLACVGIPVGVLAASVFAPLLSSSVVVVATFKIRNLARDARNRR